MAELQYPNIAGNFLSGMRDAQAGQLQQQQAVRQGQAFDQQNTQFDQGQQDRQTAQASQKREQLIAALRTVKTPEDFQRVQQFAVGSLGIPQEKVMQYRFEDVPALLSTSSQAPAYAAQDLERQRFAETSRHNRAEEAAAAAARATAGASGKTPEARKALAMQYGLDPNSDEGRAFILTGDLPKQGRQTLTATDKEAILGADDKVLSTTQGIDMLKSALALSGQSLQGGGSNSVAQITSLFGDKAGTNTVEFDNLLQGQVLPQLKVIFGGAPTEGERAILLQLQGSSSLSREARERIITRAVRLAEGRLQQYKTRAQELRGGTYYDPKGQPPQTGFTPTEAPNPLIRQEYGGPNAPAGATQPPQAPRGNIPPPPPGFVIHS